MMEVGTSAREGAKNYISSEYDMQSYMNDLVLQKTQGDRNTLLPHGIYREASENAGDERDTLFEAVDVSYFGESRSRGLSLKYSSTTAGTHTCRVCEKTFRASSLLDIHMRVHVGAKPFVCPVCGHRATQKGNLKLHMKKHHGADLPPHIDLVPDSGIWGHPQEDLICIGVQFPNDAVDKNDPTGKRKQVAQAVSSMLDEEVVELIKKCQNNVGQGMTGRITESLEDFIHIAKNKADLKDCVPRSRRTEPVVTQEENYSSLCHLEKLRHRNSMRFVPYKPKTTISMRMASPIASGFQASGEHSSEMRKGMSNGTGGTAWNEMADRMMSSRQEQCKSCGHNIPFSPNCVQDSLCQNCSSHFQPIADMRVLNPKDSDLVTTVNGIVAHTTSESPNRSSPSICCACGVVFVSRETLESHKKKYHTADKMSDEDTTSFKSDMTVDKENYMHAVGLLERTRDNGEETITESGKLTGLDPVINNVAWMLCNGTGRVSPPETLTEIPRGKLQLKNSGKTVSLKDKCKLEIEKRARMSVLKILRRTVLSSVEKKVTFEIHPVPKSECNFKEKLPRMGRNSPTRETARSKPDSLQYRNRAMQSLAKIGKTSLRQEEPQCNEGFTAEKTQSNTYKEATWIARDENLPAERQSVILSLHDQASPGFHCQYCPKWFKYRSVLEIHMRSHTGERPYKCPYCDYAGTQHNCLKLHIQRHHPREYISNHIDTLGGRGPGLCMTSNQSTQSGAPSSSNRVSCFSPVKCPICGRVSPSPGYLKIHMRSHKKSLDHICHICGRGFKEYWYLSTHLKTHERELTSLRINMSALQDSESISPRSFWPLKIQSMEETRKNDTTLGKECRDKSLSDGVFSRGLVMKENNFHGSLPEGYTTRDNLLAGNENNSNRNTAISPTTSNRSKSPNDFSRDYQVKQNEHTANGAAGSLVDAHFGSSMLATSHTSRRKASCPIKITFDPYPSEISTGTITNEVLNVGDFSSVRRKGRPRKLHKGSYLSPPLSRLSFSNDMDKSNATESNLLRRKDTVIEKFSQDDLPLDLSCTSKKCGQKDEEINSIRSDGPLDLCVPLK